MGMFDTVHFLCPNCRADVELQSKAGDCRLHDYTATAVPVEIALSLENEKVYCENCESPLIIISYTPVPKTVSMIIIPYKEE